VWLGAMESILPIGGLRPGFQRRLSRLYNDTKKSSDFVKEPVQSTAADPEIKSLHRKLKIQKDRLVSWGLEWSDPNQSAEVLIDSSLTKAGLSEVVQSIMSTIKDILDEAEPLWHSSRRQAGERPDPDRKIQLVVWDKNRFEDLVRDLTTSIDTLYDLSRTRSSYAQSSAAARERQSKASAAEDLRPFESSRIDTPQQIDPKTLKSLRDLQAVPMTEREGRERARDVVFMERSTYAELTQALGSRQPHAPLLLEYAGFDSIFSVTGIPPRMDRFGKLFSGLQAESSRASASWTGLPRLLGYYEDMDSSRFGLVYQFPKTFNPVSFEHLTQNPLYNLCSLADLLARPDFEPKLEAKFRLAANLANTIFDMHARNITHGNLLDENVTFCNAVGTDPEVSGITQGEVDIRRPLVSSFDLFWDPQLQDEPRPFSLYKHQLDPRNSPQSPLTANADSKTFDLYSLAMILLSVGLWTKLENLIPDPASPVIPESVLEQLAIRCGTLYMKAVQVCWNAVDQELAGTHTSDEIVSRVQFKATRYLETCCILDGVSNLEERLGDDLGEPARTTLVPKAGSSKDVKGEETIAEEKTTPHEAEVVSHPTAEQGTLSRRFYEVVNQELTLPAPDLPEAPAQHSSAKMRLYPHIPLAPDIVERWNNIVMPQINTALRHFYRKNPESVEISLESIGESPQLTKPTVLVVCTSVSKVRAILKKKAGELFDNAGFGLKVCRGQVLRSRKDPGAGSADNTGNDGDEEEEIPAANPGYQERPQNGASIGAYIGQRHNPAVSFGGLIVVDDKTYGMTVHHMLDDPEGQQDSGVTRSMAGPQGVPDLHAWYAAQYQNTDSDFDSSESEGYSCEFSDSDSDTYSESAITSDDSDDGEDEDEGEEGDVPGIEPGLGDGYVITQPALDDVVKGFFPDDDTRDEEHVLAHELGRMYASSGIRRRTLNGQTHEIDWALFEFMGRREPEANVIPRVEEARTRGKRAKNKPAGPAPPDQPLRPTAVASTSNLPGLEVQCMARTSGLQTGQILQTVASVKLYKRMTPSQLYQVSGSPSEGSGNDGVSLRAHVMGMPGDSGAWVVERHQGLLCGHILAFSQRKRITYICPMDVLLHDIAETLEADEIRLPGGDVVKSFEDYCPKRMNSVVSRPSRMSSVVSRPSRVSSIASRPSRMGSYRQPLSKAEPPSPTLIESTHGGEIDDDDDEDSFYEGVEVDLSHDLKALALEEPGRPAVNMGKLGLS